MSKKQSMKPLAVAIGAALATTVSAGASASPFSMNSLHQGYMIASPDDGGGMDKKAEGKCGEGKCGTKTMAKMGYDGHCGGQLNAKGKEAHCGGATKMDDDKMKGHDMDSKGKEGSCGGDKDKMGNKMKDHDMDDHDMDNKGKEGSCGGSK